MDLYDAAWAYNLGATELNRSVRDLVSYLKQTARACPRKSSRRRRSACTRACCARGSSRTRSGSGSRPRSENAADRGELPLRLILSRLSPFPSRRPG